MQKAVRGGANNHYSRYSFSSKLKQMNPEERSKLYFTAKLASKVAKEIEESCYELLKMAKRLTALV